jgi:glycosyltransferase involved in cell wall biosynthesis
MVIINSFIGCETTVKIILDLQSLQTDTRTRGIGRYSLSLAKEILVQGRKHDIYIILNHSFQSSYEQICDDFSGVIRASNILLWRSPIPLPEIENRNIPRIKAAEFIREYFIKCLKPDIVHVFSLFDGWVNNFCASVGTLHDDIPTVVTLYDLIPLVMQKQYLSSAAYKNWYYRKLDSLKRSDLLFAISESVKNEAVELLGMMPEQVVNVSTDADSIFRKISLDEDEKIKISARLGIHKRFIMYTAGWDVRKNVDELIVAYTLLPKKIRNTYQLLIIFQNRKDKKDYYKSFFKKHGVRSDEVVFSGFVSDEDLVRLYNRCSLFVFPSLHEGFGLPVLEAMRCGAPVIGSNTSSIPEVIGFKDALFKPDAKSIAEKIIKVLTDDKLYAELIRHSELQQNKFSWNKSTRKILEAYENLHGKNNPKILNQGIKTNGHLERKKLAYVLPSLGIYTDDEIHHKLITMLSEHYDIDIVNSRQFVSWQKLNFVSIEKFKHQSNHYGRILYHFYNDESCLKLYELLLYFPGSVVLHDKNMCSVFKDNNIEQALYYSHGYNALMQMDRNGKDDIVSKYSCDQMIIDKALGVFNKDNIDSEADFVLAIETHAKHSSLALRKQLFDSISAIDGLTDRDLEQLALSVAENEKHEGTKQLFLDISTLITVNSQTGIQRVVMNILYNLLQNSPQGYTVEPVYRTLKGYVYARRFTQELLGCNVTLEDSLMDVNPGDVFFGLDLYLELAMRERALDYLNYHKQRGLIICFLVHDLLPVSNPEWFTQDNAAMFKEWLALIYKLSDRFICVSQTTAKNLEDWFNSNIQINRSECDTSIVIDSFHLGADIHKGPSFIDPINSNINEQYFKNHKIFDNKNNVNLLMVGTIEPRKGHVQALNAMELLWNKKINVNLIFSGKQGWKMDEFMQRINKHPQKDKRLFWLGRVDDETLQDLYLSSSALLNPSYGEGFGLPLIEAAQAGLPIIARDLPVFKEVAGEHAFYFSGQAPQSLASSILEWFDLYKSGKYPQSLGLKWLTWEQSTSQLLKCLSLA